MIASKTLRSGLAAFALLAGAAPIAQTFLAQPAFARDSRDSSRDVNRDKRGDIRDSSGKSERQYETNKHDTNTRDR